MEMVLGLSMTSASIGWVLLDGTGSDADTVDHDHFDIGPGSAHDGDISTHEAAVRGAQAIAAASGHQVTSIGVTWTGDVDAKAQLILKALPAMGFDSVVAAPLADATRAWAQVFRRSLGFDSCAVCVVDASAVNLVSVVYKTTRTASTQMRESADGLGRWLTEVLARHRCEPERLFLIGSRGDLELISGPLDEALAAQVDVSDDAQVALARGAALNVSHKHGMVDESTVVVPSESSAPAPRSRTRRRSWFGPHARAATALAAGAIALFAVVPALAGQSEPGPAVNPTAPPAAPAAADSSTTSVRVQAVPRPPVAPAVPAAATAPIPPVPTAPVPPPVEPEAMPALDAVPTPEPEFVEDVVPVVAAVDEPADQVIEPVATPAGPEAAPVVAPAAVPAQPAAALPPAPEALPPAPAAPPPDPIAVVLSPLFGALP